MTSQAIESQKSYLAIQVVTGTVSITIDNTTHKISRAAGSWITDGYLVGMEIVTTDPTNKGPFTVTAVSANDLTMQATDALTTDAVAAPFDVTGYFRVKEVHTFTGFDGQSSEIDVTSLDSVAKEFLIGLEDFGQFQVDCNYLPADAGQMKMRAAKTARTVQAFRFYFSDGSKASFSGYVKQAPVNGGVDNKIDTTFTIRVTGAVIFA